MTLLFVLLFSVHFLITAIFQSSLVCYWSVMLLLGVFWCFILSQEQTEKASCKTFVGAFFANLVHPIMLNMWVIQSLRYIFKLRWTIISFVGVHYLVKLRIWTPSRFCLDFKILIAKLVQRSKKEKEKKYDQQITRSYSCKG